MKKFWVIMSCLFTAGILLCATGGIIYAASDEGEAVTVRKTVEYTAGESIIAECTTKNVTVQLGESNEVVFEYTEEKNDVPEIKKEDGAVKIEYEKKISTFWYPFRKTPKLKVYLPKTFEGDLLIVNSTGDIRAELPGAKIKALKMETSTGNINVKNIETKGDVSFVHTTGTVEITNVKSNGNAWIQGSTGDTKISFLSVAGTINVESSTGSIETAEVYAGGSFSGKTSTGDATYFVDSAIVRMKASTGSIKFEVKNALEITAETSTGDVEGIITGKESEYSCYSSTSTGENNLVNRTGGAKKLYVETSTGDIEVRFKEEQ